MRVVTTAAEATLPGDIVIPGWAAHPDAVPSSPSAFDDEFDDDLTGWTTMGPTTIALLNADVSIASHLYVQPKLGVTSVLQGVYKAAPSLPFTMTAKITANVVNINGSQYYTTAGIYIAEATPGKLYGITGPNNETEQNLTVEFHHWADPDTFTMSNTVDPLQQGYASYLPMYLRLDVDSGGLLTPFYSFDGLLWTQRYAQTDPAFTVGSIALATNRSDKNIASSAAFDWVRFT